MIASPTDFQIHLFHEGNFFRCYELFGSHVIKSEKSTYTRFCVWAPTAKKVSLAGTFNCWNAKGWELSKLNDQGVWMLTIQEDLTGELYKYEMETRDGNVILKADPFAFRSEQRPNTASVVHSFASYKWDDGKWMRGRTKKDHGTQPMAIYEIHLGSWKLKQNGSFITYRELAGELIPYVREHGYTHIEIMPLCEHPLDVSWGYQATGYYSVTSRYGNPEDFMYLVDQCHQNGLGVILDWVPGHFCKDEHGLYRFDGDFTYEYENIKDRENIVWGTANFDLGKTEVQSFLISNAIFWAETYHIDGFRVDAVANIIYWPNSSSSVNPYGLSFLQKLNKTVSSIVPGVIMMAEDSTDWPDVTLPVEEGGLGFTYKWNMGWMNDILEYMEAAPPDRKLLHENVSFSLVYAFSESFILPFSHDEVVHGKKSLLDKMPGDYWQKFAQLRLLLGYMIAHPGKKLTFMGTELAPFAEWKDEEQLDWHLLQYESHLKLNSYVKDLMKVYKREKSLYENDRFSYGFEWIDVNNHEQSVFSFVRKGRKAGDFLVIICNFTSTAYSDYRVGVPQKGAYREILNSDDEIYGGSGVVNRKPIQASNVFFHGRQQSVAMNLPPFGISILRPVKTRKRSAVNAK
ncbi:1,4-alpha-glucan branching enzyme [Bacillus massilinigeriensis]|uniref:1,4-alpha-glucan branching enzyme n=1 Tax=Bacillus mediterraneensis TaxID=1805474 RepID=UPI0008F946E2|nr:1,4-alpha-glucan branching enzyme [Bacillus mediterraneensis]